MTSTWDRRTATSCRVHGRRAACRGAGRPTPAPRHRRADRAPGRVAELDILTMGITFTVYSDGRGIDRAWPFDVIPRVIAGDEWAAVERGLVQRLRRAQPVHRRHLQRAAGHRRRRVPGRAARRTRPTSARSAAACTRRSACGRTSAAAISCATTTATMYVLEDNLRVPSGVSYVLENRADRQAGVRRPVRSSRASCPSTATPTSSTSCWRRSRPTASASRRSSCSRRASTTRRTSSTRSSPSGWGAELVEGARPRRRRRRLRVHAHDRRAASACDVIYRRIDDLFLDPEVFRPDSTLGVPGPDAGVAGRQRRHRQRARRRRGRRQGRLRLGARHHPLLPRRGAADPERADVPLHVRRRAARSCSTTSASSS